MTNLQTDRRRYKVDRKEIMYIRYTIESYSGIAVVRTIDPYNAVIEIQIAPGCEQFIQGILADFSIRERLRIIPFPFEK